MMRLAPNIARIAAGFLFASAAPVFARQAIQAHAETGARGYGGNTASSRFDEYRDRSKGTIADSLSLGFGARGSTLGAWVWASRIGRSDQFVAARLSTQGRLTLQASRREIPHAVTNSARSMHSGAGGAVLEIPADVRKRLRTIFTTDTRPEIRGIQFDTAALTGLVNGTARPVGVASHRERWTAAGTAHPLGDLHLSAEYANERKTGTRPAGAEFFYHVPTEIVAPTNTRTEDGSVRAELAAGRWSLEAGYAFSRFSNDEAAVVWDNPFRESDLIGGASRGRMSLEPGNESHRFTLSGGAHLPLETRLTAALAYGTDIQNQAFIPQTINAAVETLRALPPLPFSGLDGRATNRLLNLTLVNRFFSAAWFSARFRFFDRENRSAQALLPASVDQDNLIFRTPVRNLLPGYQRAQLSADATFRLPRRVSVRLGFGRDSWVRSAGGVGRTREDSYTASADYAPPGILSVRASHTHARRQTAETDAAGFEKELFPGGLPAGLVPQLAAMRRFDAAPRRRDRSVVTAQAAPSRVFDVSVAWEFLHDRYPETEYGTTWSRSRSLSVSSTVAPSLRAAFSLGCTRELFDAAILSRQRAPGNDSPGNDWRSDVRDAATTLHAGARWTVVPGLVEASLDGWLSDSRGEVAALPLGDPSRPGFLAATASDYPETREILRQVSASVRYRFGGSFTQRVEYRFEGSTQSSFASGTMEPTMIAADPAEPRAVYLGARQPGYEAHTIVVTLSYDL